MKEWQNTHIHSFPINKLNNRQIEYIQLTESKKVALYKYQTHYSYHLDRQKFVSLTELFQLNNQKIIQLTQGQWLQILIAILTKYKEIEIIEHRNLLPEHIWIKLLKGYYSLTPEITQIDIVLSNFGGFVNDRDQLQLICSQLFELIPEAPKELRKLIQAGYQNIQIADLQKFIDDHKKYFVRLILDFGIFSNTYENEITTNQNVNQNDRILSISSSIPPQNKPILRIIRGLMIDEMVLNNQKAIVDKIKKRFEEIISWIDQGFKNYMGDIESELFKQNIFRHGDTTWPQEQHDHFRAIFEKEFEYAMMDSKYFNQVIFSNIQINGFRSLKYEDIQIIAKGIFNDKLMSIIYADHKQKYLQQVQNYMQALKSGI